MAVDLVEIDLTDQSAFGDAVPHEDFDVLRRSGGVTWHAERPAPPSDGGLLSFVDSPGFWSVTSHESATAVLRNQPLFSSQLGGVFLPTLAPESLDTFRQMLLNMDAPEHTRLRRILQPIFTPRAIERLHASIDQNAREIADALDGRDGCELVTAVSADLPLRVLADLLGMPREDRHLIYGWSNALIGLETQATPPATGRGTAPGRSTSSASCSCTASRWPMPAGPSPATTSSA